jgi:hypothetical protein
LPFKIFGSGFCIPSLSPADYRANGCTPIAAYRALFDSAKSVANADPTVLNIKSLVFIDAKDELVSSTNLQKLIVDGTLDQWQLEKVDIKASTLPTSYHHLIIDSAAVGPKYWTEIERKILDYLKSAAT